MKKYIFTFFSCLTLFTSLNANSEATYNELPTPASNQANVIEFFSFYCPHCYDFEYRYHIPQKIAQSLPKDVSFHQYHLAFIGPQGERLTRAWSLAILLGVQDKVRQPLFNATQKAGIERNNDAPTMDEIRQIFLNAGVSQEEFNAINSFTVTALTKKQDNLAQKFNVQGVPDFYVNGKYRINPEALPKNEAGFVEGYIKTIQDLLQKP